jgi:hypothetical protein
MYVPRVTTVLLLRGQYCVLIRLMDEGGLTLKLMLCYDIHKTETFVMLIVQNIPRHKSLFYWYSGAIYHELRNGWLLFAICFHNR